MNASFLQTRITQVESIITGYENAIIALTTAGVQSYELDTGQSKQKVTKLDIESMQKALDSLYNTYSILCKRLNGNGVQVRMGF